MKLVSREFSNFAENRWAKTWRGVYDWTVVREGRKGDKIRYSYELWAD